MNPPLKELSISKFHYVLLVDIRLRSNVTTLLLLTILPVLSNWDGSSVFLSHTMVWVSLTSMIEKINGKRGLAKDWQKYPQMWIWWIYYKQMTRQGSQEIHLGFETQVSPEIPKRLPVSHQKVGKKLQFYKIVHLLVIFSCKVFVLFLQGVV